MADPLPSTTDWSSTVDTLTQAGDGAELWRWALRAPPVHASRLLRALPAEAYPPSAWGPSASDLPALARALPAVESLKHALANQANRLLTHDKWSVDAIAWSPDGRCLATVGGGAIRLWDAISGTCIRTLQPPFGRLQTVAWSPDGRFLAAWIEGMSIEHGHRNWIGLWDTAGGPCLETLSDVARPWTMHWLGQDAQLAYTSTRNAILVWNATTKSSTPILEGHPWQEEELAWAPDGRHLASAARDATITLWDLTSATRTHRLEGHTRRIRALGWSANGDCLASASADQTIRLWDPTRGTGLHTLQSPRETITHLIWAPHGRRLATVSHDQTIRLWDGARGTCYAIPKNHHQTVHKIAFSTDGLVLASASEDRTIHLWNAANGACTHRRNLTSAAPSPIAWSPDGWTLAVVDGDRWIHLWRRDHHELAALLETPLSQFESHHWNLVAACQRTCPPRDRVVLPWLRFMSGLGAVIRSFDVSVDRAANSAAPSAFAVILDGLKS
ncbi:MAG: WD40 repeat domain-containing protein [Cyanobium sp.]